MNLTRDQARQAARALAGARVALGILAFLAPTVPARPWVGEEAKRRSVHLFSRALGARDIALGAGLLLTDGPIRGWVEAGGLADSGDVVATLLGWKAAPRIGRLAVLLAAGGSAVAARVLAPVVD